MQRQGNIIARDESGVWAEFSSPGCHGCRAGCKQARQRIFIPAQRIYPQRHGFSPANQGRMALRMANSNLGMMIFRALLLPLCGFVTGAIVADFLALADACVFVCAASGLVIMIGFSRAMSITALQIEATVGPAL